MEFQPIIIRVLLWLMMLLIDNGCYGCLEQERIALLQLKTSINNSFLFVGDEGIADCCKWEHVECDNTTRGIVKLDLQMTFRSRDLNTSMFLPFESLTSLDLSYNSLRGCVENEGFEKLSKLSNLRILDLSTNNFNNSILASLNELSSLKTLNLQDNNLAGLVYIEDFDGLNGLKKLDISRNNLDGIVTREGLERAQSWNNLEILDLSDNFLQNDDWSILHGLPSLKTLYMGGTRNNVTKGKPINFRICSHHIFFILRRAQTHPGCPLHNIFFSLKLDLHDNEIGGELPRCMANLTSLRFLDISSNHFTGELPRCMANLTSLRFLDISSNHFPGNIESSPLIHLTSLEYLFISDNYFKIPISFRSFFNHSKLKVFESLNNELLVETGFQSLAPSFQLIGIRLSDPGNVSRISGGFPNFLYYQKDLKIVELSGLNFKRKFPSWLLKNNTRLMKLLLANNSFSGPLCLPSHPQSELLALSIINNFLSGHIPDGIATAFPGLEWLYMSGNRFGGSIPSSIGDLPSLVFLDLSNNKLSGTIPTHLAMGCFSLRFLRLSNNNLQGPILPTRHNLTFLTSVRLDHNNLTEIPGSFSNCSYLLYLDMSHNNISGRIPGWMGNMSNLEVLAMSNNHLEGPIPTELYQLESLVYLDLSVNNITGTLRSCFKSSYIQILQLSKNSLQGALSHTFCNSGSLAMLDLSDNHFTGGIPDCIGNLSELTILHLKNNHFEGNVPISLCHLSQLRLIDLSYNNLSGHIPPCLNISFEVSHILDSMFFPLISSLSEWFVFLSKNKIYTEQVKLFPRAVLRTDKLPESFFPQTQAVLRTKGILLPYEGLVLDLISGIDLSANKLTGHIPLQMGNLSQIQFLNLSHNSLSGGIPSTFSNLKSIESLDLSNNNLNGEIPSQLTVLTALSDFNVSYNNLSGRTPPRTFQFANYEENSYAGNPLLCGDPITRSCTATQPAMPTNGSEADDGSIDMGTFYASFAASYVTVLLAIAAVLYINPYWRRAWFYRVEVCITSCYYFVVDNLMH